MYHYLSLVDACSSYMFNFHNNTAVVPLSYHYRFQYQRVLLFYFYFEEFMYVIMFLDANRSSVYNSCLIVSDFQ